MNEIIVDLITPFNHEGNIDYEKLYELLDYQIDSRVDKIVLLGSVSEAESLTLDERLELLNKSISYVNNRIGIIVGINQRNIIDILQFDKLLDKLNFECYIINNDIKSNETGLVKYYTQLADKLSKQIILNDENMSINVIKRLSYHPKIIGIKMNKDINKLIEIANIYEDFKIYCGEDWLMLPSIMLGVSGIISVVGNAYPILLKEIYELDDNLERLKSFNKYKQIIHNLTLERPTIIIKYLMEILGLISCNVRSPFDRCSKEVKQQILIDYLNL